MTKAIQESEIKVKYNAYLLKWLMSDVDTLIDTEPISYEKYKENLLNERNSDYDT